jgi:hypothetical protein
VFPDNWTRHGQLEGDETYLWQETFLQLRCRWPLSPQRLHVTPSTHSHAMWPRLHSPTLSIQTSSFDNYNQAFTLYSLLVLILTLIMTCFNLETQIVTSIFQTVTKVTEPGISQELQLQVL